VHVLGSVPNGLPQIALHQVAESYARFPGFANEIQGVYPEQVEGRTRLYTYVVRE
jgi:ornithine decarboxylase